jgi:hypothetical protein
VKFNKQLIKHDPENGQWGDCFRTAISCLLDLEPQDVPHFCDNDADARAVVGNTRAWLAQRGLSYIEIPYDAEPDVVLQCMAQLGPEQHWILGGRSTKADHVVVCCGGKIINDPSGNGIVGRCSDGYTWVCLITHRTIPGEPAPQQVEERPEAIGSTCEHEWERDPASGPHAMRCTKCPATSPF